MNRKSLDADSPQTDEAFDAVTARVAQLRTYDFHIESNDAQLAVAIAGGGKNAFEVACFAILWNGIVVFISIFVVSSLLTGDRSWKSLLLSLMFWAVGLGLVYSWAKIQFMQELVLVEPDRLVIERTLFRWKWREQTRIDPKMRAMLRPAYTTNMVVRRQVFDITMDGIDARQKFGRSLDLNRQNQLIDAIDAFLKKHHRRRRRLPK